MLTDAVPDDEDAVLLSMLVYAAAGRRGEALRVYQQLQVHLLRAFGSTPDQKVRAAFEAIRTGERIDDALARLMRVNAERRDAESNPGAPLAFVSRS